MGYISSRRDEDVKYIDPEHLETVAELVDAVRIFAATKLMGLPVDMFKVDNLLLSAVDTLNALAKEARS